MDCLRAGYGKVAILKHLRGSTPIGHNHLVYVGDGSSDIHVMLHVNRLDGLTIAVCDNCYLTQIAKRTVIREDALSILVPIMDDILKLDTFQIRSHFEGRGFIMQEWDKVQTETVTIVNASQENNMWGINSKPEPHVRQTLKW